MSHIFDDNPLSVGNTPLIRLNRIAPGKARVLAKIEARNPSFSVKCRLGVGLIRDAEENGLLRPGREIIEPTSGNTGIALAFVCASRGYKLTLCMPETMSIERRRVLSMLGAQIELTPGPKGMTGAVLRAEEIAASDPERYYLPQQFKNPANPRVHEQTTGPEIWNDTDGTVDALIACVGTGGTITGCTRFLKSRKKEFVSIAVEPKESPVITQFLAGQPLTPGPHAIQGIGAGFIPETLDVTLLDRVETVGGEEAMKFARRLAKEEGILSGISSGAAACIAARMAPLDEFSGKTIVLILPDAGERYLSTALFE